MARNFDPIRDFDRLIGGVARTVTGAALPMDLYQAGGSYYAEVDLPGVDPESIDIDVEDRTLTIRAERSTTPSAESPQWLTRERPTGTFARQLSVGRNVDLSKVVASYEDGVLRLTIPVAEEAKPRKISVQHGSRGTVVTGEATSPVDTTPETGTTEA